MFYLSSHLIILCLYAEKYQMAGNAAHASFKVCSWADPFSFIKYSIDVVYCLFKLTSLKLREKLHIILILIFILILKSEYVQEIKMIC